MKKYNCLHLYTLALLWILLSFTRADAGYRAIEANEITGVSSSQDLVLNPGFEINKLNWTSSSPTITRSTSSPLRGVASITWDSSSAGQTLRSAAYVIPTGLYGKSAVAYCSFQCATGTCTHTVGAYDGSTEYGLTAIVSTTTGSAIGSGAFTMPTSGSIQLEIKSVASNEPNLKIDDCHIVDAASAQTGGSSSGGGLFAGGQNLITNNSWEANTNNWTASAGTYARTTTAGQFAPPGVAAASWDPAASADTLTANDVTITSNDGISGRNGVLSCLVKTAATDLKMQVYDGSNVISPDAVTDVVPTSSAGFYRYSVNFIFPDSGTIKARFKAQSNSVVAYIDDCFMGAAEGFNIFQTSQATFIGSAYIPKASSCTWARTNAALGSFATTSACVGPTVEFNPGPGVIQTTDTDLPKFTVNNLPPGMYEVKISIEGEASSDYAFGINDGTTTSGITGANGNTQQPTHELIGYFNYTTTANRTFEVYGSSGTGAVTLRDNVATSQMNFSIVRYPLTPDTAYVNNYSYFPTQQRITASGACTYTLPTSPRPSYLEIYMVGGGGGGAATGTSPGSNNNGGNTTFSTFLTASGGAGGSNTGGATYTISSPAYGNGVLGAGGSVLTAAPAATDNTSGGQGGNSPYFSGAGGVQAGAAGKNAQTNTGAGGGGAGSGSITNGQSASGGSSGAFIHAYLPNPASTYSCNVGVKGAGATAGSGGGTAGGDGADGQIFVNEFYGQTPYPLLVGSIISDASGSERVERAKINCQATTAVTLNSGSWVTCGNISSNACTCTITSGIFSSTPVCVGSPDNQNNGATIGNQVQVTSSTSFIITGVHNIGGTTSAETNYIYNVICMGPH